MNSKKKDEGKRPILEIGQLVEFSDGTCGYVNSFGGFIRDSTGRKHDISECMALYYTKAEIVAAKKEAALLLRILSTD